MVLVQANILVGPQDFGIWEKFFINLTVYELVINIPSYQMSDLLNLLKTEIRIGMNEEFSIGKAQLRGRKTGTLTHFLFLQTSYLIIVCIRKNPLHLRSHEFIIGKQENKRGSEIKKLNSG